MFVLERFELAPSLAHNEISFGSVQSVTRDQIIDWRDPKKDEANSSES